MTESSGQGETELLLHQLVDQTLQKLIDGSIDNEKFLSSPIEDFVKTLEREVKGGPVRWRHLAPMLEHFDITFNPAGRNCDG